MVKNKISVVSGPVFTFVTCSDLGSGVGAGFAGVTLLTSGEETAPVCAATVVSMRFSAGADALPSEKRTHSICVSAAPSSDVFRSRRWKTTGN
jgi:hypothetical protein